MTVDPFDGFTVARADAWNETPFRDVAMPDGFNQTEYLDYSDVAVIINNESEASRTIGWAFVNARNIPLENILLLTNESTPTGETINRNQFNTYFAEPFLDWLNQSEHRREGINYIVTTKGVPLRINGGNDKASFDNELALIDGSFKDSIAANWWIEHTYGPINGDGYESFSREKHGFYLVTRLTGYTVETALGLIDKANNSLGNRGNFVLDLAANRNGSGYKYWNDDLYAANTSLNGSMDLPVVFNQNSTFLTNVSNVIAYASWGSNDGTWNSNFLPNQGFDTADSAWDTGAKYWNSSAPPLSGVESWDWNRQTTIKRNGQGSLEGVLLSTDCQSDSAEQTNGLLGEYFDNAGLSVNTSYMPDLTGRNPDFLRIEPNLDYVSSTNIWPGLDSRFADHFSARFTGYLDVPESGNWTFHLGSDDGSLLFIDEVEIIDNSGVHPHAEVSSNATWLTAGLHRITVEFFEAGGWAGVDLSWTGPNMSRAVIANQYLQVGNGSLVAEDSLIHHWEFDDASGTTISDSIADADLTIHGTNAGNNWVTGLAGGAYSFDGVDEYASLDVDDWNGNFSLSMWVKTPDANQGTYSSVIAVSNSAGDKASFQIQQSGSGKWQLRNNNQNNLADIEADTWVNLAFTFEQGGEAVLYVDGWQVDNISFGNDSIDDIQLFKFGVNRAGNAYHEGLIDEVMIWNSTLSDAEILQANRRMVVKCSLYSQAGSGTTHVEQDFDFDDELMGHAWIIYGYAQKSGWMEGTYWIEVDGYAANGTLMSSNSSSTKNLDLSWNSQTMRFRPHADVVNFSIRMVSLLEDGTYNGSIYFDQMNLRAIRPHMGWMDGSIAETAVSTGGRSFNWGTSYGQSLVADLLEDGVSGVKGYVYEPYLTAVAYPSIMTSAYASGYNWAESVYMANAMMSWMGVVVGDPKMAAFSDTLHDANISDVRTNGTPTKDRMTGLQVIIDNLAPMAGNGTLEVRERQGNALVGSINLSLAGGDESGSRLMVEVPIIPQRTGYTEFMVRWVNHTGFNERIKDNNVHIINLLVNQPPGVSDAYCQNPTIERGGYFTCSAVVGDDSEVTSVMIGWSLTQADGNISNTSWASAGSVDGTIWWTSVSPEASSPLGMINLHVIATDNLGFESMEYIATNVSELVDATATWRGPWVEGVDAPDWSGILSLPDSGSGLARAASSTLKACVFDADHDQATQAPLFHSEVGNIGNNSVEITSTPGLTCYINSIEVPHSVELGPYLISVETPDGNRSRYITLGDQDPTASLDLRIANQSSDFATGERNTSVWLSLHDVDDPESGAYGDLIVSWPGHVEKVASFELEAGQTGVSIPVPDADEALESGDLQVALELRGAHGVLIEDEWSWPILFEPPQIVNLTLCDSAGGTSETLLRSQEYLLVMQVESRREARSVSATLSQTGWAVSLDPVDAGIWAQCNLEPTADVHLFRVSADNSFIDGGATITAVFTDLDQLQTFSSLQVQISRSAPEVTIDIPEEVMAGEDLEILITVSDRDGSQGILCTTSIIDADDREVFSLEQQVEPMDPLNGTIELDYPTPERNSTQNTPPWSISTTCTDRDGDSTTATSNRTVSSIPALECTSCDDEEEPSQKTESGFSAQKTLIATGGGLALVISLIIAILIGRQREEDEPEVWSQEISHPVTHLSEEEIKQHGDILDAAFDADSEQDLSSAVEDIL